MENVKEKKGTEKSTKKKATKKRTKKSTNKQASALEETKGATPEKIMAAIHRATASRLLQEIENPDCDPRFVGQAIKFLNDNQIKMIPEVDNQLGELEKHLQKKKRRFLSRFNSEEQKKQESMKKITDIATKQAIAMGEE